MPSTPHLLEDSKCETEEGLSSLDSGSSIALSAQPLDELWDSFDRYYCENEKSIMEASRLDILEISSRKSMRMEAAVNSFLENSKIILQGLHFLSEIHPALGAAVGAFTAVIKIELIRRDNNAKAMSVKIQMQNMMCSLFQIRLLRKDNLDNIASSNLARVMTKVAEEIKECGSDLSFYQEKKLISRLIHAQFFENRMAQHIATFAERRSEINLMLTSYTTSLVQEVAETSSRIEYKLDHLVELLQRLDTPREREAAKFIEDHGGIAHCIEDEDLLDELVKKTGLDAAQNDTVLGEDNTRLKNQLLEELGENIEEILKRNLTNFDAMLRIQNNNLQHMSHLVENQTSQISKMLNTISLAFPGARKHVLLTDPVMQKIWLEMGLRQSVKAEKFILTFKDYHTRQHTGSPMILATPNAPLIQLPPAGTLETTSGQPTDAFVYGGGEQTREQAEADEWALGYIDIAHLDPLIEAMDDDFSGYLSIHEVNRFAVARPKEWSLLRWCAYWAAGWALSVERYKKSILQTVHKIYDAYAEVLPFNQAGLGDYLDGQPFLIHLDVLLRSTQPFIGETERADRKLVELVEDYDRHLEDRLLANLKHIKFKLTSVEAVRLVTGPGRIERYALPLLDMMLKHHLRIFKLASRVRLHWNQLNACNQSLIAIFQSLEARAAVLEAIFRQKARSVEESFKKFSFGMLLGLESKPSEYIYKDNILFASHIDKDKTILDEPIAQTPVADDLTSNDANERASSQNEPTPNYTSKYKITDEDRDVLPTVEPLQDTLLDRPMGESYIYPLEDRDLGRDDIDQEGVYTFSGEWSLTMHRDRGYSVLQKDLALVKLYPMEPTGTELIGVVQSIWETGSLNGTVVREGQQREGGGEPVGEDTDASPPGGQIVAIHFTADFTSGHVLEFHAKMESGEGWNPFCWKGEWTVVTRPSTVTDPAILNDTAARPFELTRRPPHACRFLHLLEPPANPDPLNSTSSDTPQDVSAQSSGDITTAKEGASTMDEEPSGTSSNSVAAARWKFALSVVHYQVRRRLHSKSFYAEAAKERRHWIALVYRATAGSRAAVEEWLPLRQKWEPTITSVWQSIGSFYWSRHVLRNVSSGAFCDSCSDYFSFVRHLCITCHLDSLQNQIDLCGECVKKQSTIVTSDFTHKPSHTLLKTRRRILALEHPHQVLEARARAKRVKRFFHKAGPKREVRYTEDVVLVGLGRKKKEDQEKVYKCHHCTALIQLPSFVCMVCPQDTFICTNCDEKDLHNEQHLLIRIADEVEVETHVEDHAQVYLKSAMASLSDDINGRMTSLESKVEEMKGVVSTHHPVCAILPATTPSPDAEGPTPDGDEVAKDAVATHDKISSRIDDIERSQKELHSRLGSIEALLHRLLENRGE